MLYQDTELLRLLRLLVILIPQPFIAILLFFLAFKLVKRKTTRPTLTLVSFYILTAFGFIFNALTQFLSQLGLEEILYLFYFISSYLLLFAFIFIPLFIITILKTELEFKKQYYILIIIMYAILSALLYFTPGGIVINENGSVLYSIPFFFIVYLFFTLSITIPTIHYSIRLYATFNDKKLKKKLRIFLFGVFQALVIIYGVVFFNTTYNPLYKSIWGVIVFFLLLSAGLCIYYGLGKNL